MLKKICGHSNINAVISALGGHTLCRAEGLVGSSQAHFLSALLCVAPDRRFNSVLVILPGVTDADHFANDLRSFQPLFFDEKNAYDIIQFPMWDIFGEENSPLAFEAFAERALALKALRQDEQNSKNVLIVASVQALLQPTIAPDRIEKGGLDIAAGNNIAPEKIAEFLVSCGYTRNSVVELRGEFSVRGGILDVFPLAEEFPFRLEFFGDTVESIRTFDPATQRSIAKANSLRISEISPERARNIHGETTFDLFSIVDHLPKDTLVVISEPENVLARAEQYAEQMKQEQVLTCSYPGILEQVLPMPRLYVGEDVGSESEEKALQSFVFQTTTIQRFEGNIAEVIGELKKTIESEGRVCIFCYNMSEKDRLKSLLTDSGLPEQKLPVFYLGRLFAGYRLADENITVLTDHEIFNRYNNVHTIRHRKHAAPINSFIELEPDDYVVHENFGIGLYRGIERLKIRGQEEDHLEIMFAENARVHVPVSCIFLVQKYVGGGEIRPELSKLGTGNWARKKEIVRRSLEKVAKDLIELHAARQSQQGIAYPPDDEEQRRFEASFIYEETPDQLRAIHDIKQDMFSETPMDRLLCGDVGFGKTEVALRAAFKCVMSGRQAAILVPTTILAQQHFETFSERLADYPILIGCLNRFRTRKEQDEIIARLKEGALDIVIGTHRLLQKDVGFRDLGLVIIDEEQRFGVRNKEQLKMLRQEVDVLTLTATPIPRTLHMSLMGLKNISALETPPEDRLSIITKVVRFDPNIIRRAVLRELERDGQVYFVHNRVFDIHIAARKIQAIVPESRIGIVHGQMQKTLLRKVMKSFVKRELDILVATTIIESGIDIPNVNTIFIDDADRYGLADLHQLRGRIGRYKHRAFAYLLLPPHHDINKRAKKRLRALEEYSELGAGFKLAMKDLEIRGAGNILGVEQHGHIATIGYELYCRLLERTVRRMRGETEEKTRFAEPEEVTVNIGHDSYIPDDYIPEAETRLEIYRRIASIMGEDDILAISCELEDRFGVPPKMVKELFNIARLRYLARYANVVSIELVDERKAFLRLKFSKAVPQDAENRLKSVAKHVARKSKAEIEFFIPKDKKNTLDFAKKLLTLLGS